MPLDRDCLTRLKLRQDPFDAIPSEEFLYSDPLLESLIETAARALTPPGAIVILAGADGSGRSIQLMRLLGILGDSYELIAFRGRPNIPFDAVDVTIRNHLRAGGLENPHRSLSDLLAERAKAGAKLVLAIDDAHLLGAESIRLLLRMRAEILEVAGRGLRLILVGDPSLSRGRLPLPDLVEESQVMRLNLRPFNLEQAGAYLRHRLRVAGVEDPDSLLMAGDIAVLQTSSKGIPAALNTQATAWLARRCRSVGGFRQAAPAKIDDLVGPSGAVVTRPRPPIASPPPDLGQSDFEPPEGILELEADTYESSGDQRPLDPQLAEFLVGEGERSDPDDFEQILRHVRQHQRRQDAQSSPGPADAASAEPRPGVSKVPYWNRRWFIPAILGVVLVSSIAPVAIQLLGGSARSPQPPTLPKETVASPPSRESTTSAGPESQPPPAPVPSEVKAVDAAPPTPANAALATASPAKPATSGTPVAQADQKPEVASDKAPTPASEPEPAPQPPAATSDPAQDLVWLMNEDPAHFTIQLVAARDLATSQAFLASSALSGVRYIRTRAHVIALFGSFADRAQATRALPGLSKALRENGPWIRTIGSIRDSLP